MVFRTTSTRRRRAFSLSEMMVASALSSLALVALATLFIFTSRSCASIGNYFDLDRYSRMALDRMTREVRQARGVASFSATQVTFVDGSGSNVQYLYDGSERTLKRIAGGVTEVLLEGCDWLKFELFQRNPVGGTYDTYFAAPKPEIVKLVQVSWGCSREILGAKLNTEIVQSSKIVIRK